MAERADPDQDVAFEFTAPLSVCVDVTNPHTYLTLGPVLALTDELGIAVDWLPFPTTGMKPPPAGDDRGARHRRMRAEYQASELSRYAEAQGLEIREPFRDVDSTAASLGHLWLREHAPALMPEFLRRLCRVLWTEGRDVADARVIAETLAELGEDAPAYLTFAAGPGADALAELRRALVAAGVFTVPSLVVEGEVFVGRAHLPMVRWLLGGREGPPPI